MSVDGLWTIEFSKSEESFAGVKVEEQMNRGGILVLSENRLLGGGLSYYFVGTYSVSGSTIEITVDAIKYNDIVPGPFGTEGKAQVIFKGDVTGNSMTLRGHIKGHPDKKLVITAQQRSGIVS